MTFIVQVEADATVWDSVTVEAEDGDKAAEKVMLMPSSEFDWRLERTDVQASTRRVSLVEDGK
jgi:hypothetical protein